MNAQSESLSHFNRQVLKVQDDAYTLALYMLGNAELAEGATRSAVFASYLVFSSQRGDFRRLMLRQILRQCHRVSRRRIPAARIVDREDGFLQMFSSLSEPEREALALIHVLGLSYPEASDISGISMMEMGRNVAQALRKMAALRPIHELGASLLERQPPRSRIGGSIS